MDGLALREQVRVHAARRLRGFQELQGGRLWRRGEADPDFDVRT